MPGAGRGDRREAPAPERGEYGERGGQGVPGPQGAHGAQGAWGPPPAGYGNQGYPGQRPGNGAAPGAPSAPGSPGAPGAPGQDGQRYPGQGYGGQGYGAQGYGGRPRGGQAYPEHGGYDRPSYPPPGPNFPNVPNAPGPETAPNGRDFAGPAGYAGPGYARPGYGDPRYPGYDGQGPQGPQAPTQAYPGFGQETVFQPRGYREGPGPARPGGPGGPGGPNGPGGPGGPGRPGAGKPGQAGRKVRFRRTRKLARMRSVRIVGALFGVFLIWVTFSVGQAITANNGQSMSSNLAEWARDHYLGPVVTFGEWLSYNPPKTGGKPSFSLAVPKGQQVTPVKKAKGFTPDIPATLKSLAGSPLPGEGQWRVVDSVKGEPAIFTTFLRDATYTSYVNGIASMDQRLVSFQLHPGSEDPGPGNWGAWGATSIAPGARTGLVATFNGGFKLDSAGGGFYLNGQYHGSLVSGAASIVYYKNGTIKIGEWGRDFSMNSTIEGVRQNLKLLVDHGQVAADANSDVMSNWGATLGGGYYVWRSGLGITKDGRVVYVYGPALNAQDLGELLQRAGAVEGMQLDINPYWMKYEYYTANGHPSDPTPVNLLPTQQQSAYSYYSTYTRDFTAVYAR
jgi:Phosphodiester glycosidase